MITPQHIEVAKHTLGLDVLEPADREAILNRFGYDIIVETMTEFMTSLGEWELASFESWIEAHQHETDLLEQLIVLYPQFGIILTQLMLKLQNLNPNPTTDQ